MLSCLMRSDAFDETDHQALEHRNVGPCLGQQAGGDEGLAIVWTGLFPQGGFVILDAMLFAFLKRLERCLSTQQRCGPLDQLREGAPGARISLRFAAMLVDVLS